MSEEFEPKPFGKYFLIERLATGGMAEIYKAKTFGVDGFEKLLAIKRILPHCSNDKEFITMLIDEAKLSVLLSHTNIVQVFDLGKVGSDYFISMEFVDGINLREMMNRAKESDPKLTEDIIVFIISEVCKGLDYAHAKRDPDGNPLNIVHRDISPQNILISYEGEVKVVDFGIAKAAMNMSNTMAGVLKGKITYMSPEQALGKTVDHKTDIFSTGLMLYELLTGQKFFMGETQFEVLKKIRSTRITEETLPESIPAGLKKIIAKSLAYNAKDRFENAGDMQIELTKYLYSTYLDFSPRKLSNMVKKLFSREIENKKNKRKNDLLLDSQTRSILLTTDSQQNIVQRGENESTRIDYGGNSTASVMGTGSIDVTGQHTGTRLNPNSSTQNSYNNTNTGFQNAPPSNKIWIALTIFMFLILAGVSGFFIYKNLKSPSMGEKIGTLVINSVPPGAKIFLNDKDTNLLTPTTLSNIELNFSQKVDLKKEKFRDWSRTVTLISSQPLQVEATLESVPTGTISVSTKPEGAKLFIDGKELPNPSPTQITDLELNKTFRIRIEKEGFRPLEEPITVYAVEPIKYEKVLEAVKYGSVELKTTPPGFKVFVNSQDSGLITPVTVEKLELGKTFAIKLSKEGYADFSKNFEIKSEKTESFVNKFLSLEEIKKREEDEKKKLEELRKKQEEDKRKCIEKFGADSPKCGAVPKPDPKPDVKPDVKPDPKPDVKPDPKPDVKPDPKPDVKPDPKPDTDSFASIQVSSNPPGADVLIDGVRRGSAPGTFKVKSGTVDVMISKDGSCRQSRTVTLKAGETRSLGTINCSGSDTAKLSIGSDPDGASVFLNGTATGKRTPLNIPNAKKGQTYKVRLELDGHEGWSGSITINDDKESIFAKLKEK